MDMPDMNMNDTGDHNHHHDDMNGMDMSNHSMHMGMKMYFHTTTGDDYLLFYDWKPATTGQMIYSCIVVFFFTILYEVVKFAREILHTKQQKANCYGKYFVHLIHYLHLIQSILHALQYLISYCLMLIAMTYQLYFFFSIIIGGAVGYLIFAPLTAKYKASYQSFADICCG